jgi:hypothetical protein
MEDEFREDASTTFLDLKHAYDILSDPVLRLVYDEYGYDAVMMVQHKSSRPRPSRMDPDDDDDDDDDDEEEEEVVYSTHRAREEKKDLDRSLYHTLARWILERKDLDQARKVVEQELQYQRYLRYQTMNYYYQRLVHMDTEMQGGGSWGNYRISRQGSMELYCTTIHSPMLDEGYTSLGFQHKDCSRDYDAMEGNWIELEKSKMGFQFTYPMVWTPSIPHTRTPDGDGHWNWTLGGNTTIKNGQGQSSANFGIGYVPSTGTDIHAQCSVDLADGKEQYKVCFEIKLIFILKTPLHSLQAFFL